MTLHSVLVKTHEETDISPHSVICRPVGSTKHLSLTELPVHCKSSRVNGAMKITPPVHEHLVHLSSDVLIQGKVRFNINGLGIQIV